MGALPSFLITLNMSTAQTDSSADLAVGRLFLYIGGGHCGTPLLEIDRGQISPLTGSSVCLLCGYFILLLIRILKALVDRVRGR